MSGILIRPFAEGDQAAVRALVLAGLKDHFGELDPTLNHDLDNIALSYVARGGIVIVAERDAVIVETGALIPVEPGVSHLVRMSVDGAARGQGLGKRLATHLIERARARGDGRVLVETNDDWLDAIALYRRCGFNDERFENGEIHLVINLR
jgi:putative acetyltransferase